MGGSWEARGIEGTLGRRLITLKQREKVRRPFAKLKCILV
jgi:hypothetical protein